MNEQPAGIGTSNCCRDLERDVDYDPEVRELLDGAGSPQEVQARMTEYVDGGDDYTIKNKTGRPETMEVSFREYDPAVAYVRIFHYATCVTGMCASTVERCFTYTYQPFLAVLVATIHQPFRRRCFHSGASGQ
jgi:hypothetical protein